MVTGEVINSNVEQYLTDFVLEAGKIGKILETLGLVVILWIIFQFISFMLHRKKAKVLDSIQRDLKRIEKKVDNLNKTKKK